MRTYNIASMTYDYNLMYLIQQTTGQATEDIVSYLYEVSNGTIIESLKTTKAQRLSKCIKYFYPNTHIPIKIKLDSLPFAWGGTVHCTIHIEFCNQHQKLTSEELQYLAQANLEKNLGLSEGVKLDKVEKMKLKIPITAREIIK